jgi:hypothetical protein
MTAKRVAPKDMTDAELKKAGMIRVPIGPFGIFGTKVMSLKNFNRQEARKAKAKNRRKRLRAEARKRKLKRQLKKTLASKKRKKAKKGKSLGFGLYWK